NDGEDEEADAVVAPEPPLRLDHGLGVEGDKEGPDHAIVAEHGTRVHVPGATAQTDQTTPRLLAGEGRRHPRLSLREPRAGRGGGGRPGLHRVEEGHPRPGRTDLYEEPLEGGTAAARGGWSRGFAHPLAEPRRPPFQIREQALALAT